jgi:hypothetical protein
MSKDRDEHRVTLSAGEDRDGRTTGDAMQSTPEKAESSESLASKLAPDPVVHIRWIPWVLAILVTMCLLLAAWVWFEILHT